jgi:shikimate kinase
MRQTRHIVIVGLMGSGKTTVAARLAKQLGWPLRDSDADLRAAHGLTVRELAERDGIDAMHVLERDHLLEALARRGPSVIAAAASSLDEPACVTAMQRPDIRTVWLRGSPEVLAGRHRAGDHRPAFGPDLVEVIRDQLERRRSAFESVADDVVDVERQRPRQIVERLLD